MAAPSWSSFSAQDIDRCLAHTGWYSKDKSLHTAMMVGSPTVSCMPTENVMPIPNDRIDLHDLVGADRNS